MALIPETLWYQGRLLYNTTQEVVRMIVLA